MKVEEIEREKRAIVAEFGGWTAHNIRLADGIYTIDNKVTRDAIRLRRIVQMVADASRQPLADLRVLDLAALEGLFSIEFAQKGAHVVAIEGRRANIAKMQFAKDVLGLGNLELVQDDVRNLSQEKYGHFDVVLCLGILYHLDVPDAFVLLEEVSRVCRGLAVIDTHVSATAVESHAYGRRTYWGMRCADRGSAGIPKAWTSIGNPISFWFSRPSLLNFLSHAGYTSVYQCLIPEFLEELPDRVTLLAIKGQRPPLETSSLVDDLPLRNIPEAWMPEATSSVTIARRLRRLVPRPVKRLVKELVDG